jgi:hypothetical protein
MQKQRYFHSGYAARYAASQLSLQAARYRLSCLVATNMIVVEISCATSHESGERQQAPRRRNVIATAAFWAGKAKACKPPRSFGLQS